MCELSRCTLPDACIMTDELCLPFHHTQYSAAFKISFISIHTHTVDLSVYISPIPINRLFQKFNIISFGILLADTIQNSIFDMTGVATVTQGTGLSERSIVTCHNMVPISATCRWGAMSHSEREDTAVPDAVSVLVNACALLAAAALHLYSSPDGCAAPCLDP